MEILHLIYRSGGPNIPYIVKNKVCNVMKKRLEKSVTKKNVISKRNSYFKR